MRPLTIEEFQLEAESAYKTVFAGNNPYDEPFQPNIKHRMLIYPFRLALNYQFNDPWLDPVVNAIKMMGEDGFYLTAFGKPKPEDQKEPYDWYIPIKDAGNYKDLLYDRENAIYSVNGRWGIICSDEDHALVGGPRELIDSIIQMVPDMDFRVNEFLEVWKYYYKRNHANIKWLPKMLFHIYEHEYAKKLLMDANLEWLLNNDAS